MLGRSMLRAVAQLFIGLLVLWSVPAVVGAEPARLALLIGNQSYAPSVGVLQNPHNDIALVGDALARQSFLVLPPVKDATRVQILDAVSEFTQSLKRAGPGAVGFLYYSGHGAAEEQTKVNYLIPVDANEPRTQTFCHESAKLDDVLDILSGAGDAAKFVVFDACRNELRLPYRGPKGLVPISAIRAACFWLTLQRLASRPPMGTERAGHTPPRWRRSWPDLASIMLIFSGG